VPQTAHLAKFSIPDHKRLLMYHVCLKMFGCLQAERTIAIRQRKFLNKFSVIHNALCSRPLFVAIAKTELESCCTDV